MKKGNSKPSQGWVREYRTYFDPSFVQVKGRLFRTGRSEKARQAARKELAAKDPDAADENSDNHEHFCIFDNSDPDGCRHNYVLAEAVRLAWDEILQKQFPERSHRLFVSNEYMVRTENDSTELTALVTSHHLLPTLRLWTHTPDNIDGLEELFTMSARGPNSAWWYNSWQFGIEARPIEIDRVFEVMIAGQRSPMTVQQVQDALGEAAI